MGTSLLLASLLGNFFACGCMKQFKEVFSWLSLEAHWIIYQLPMSLGHTQIPVEYVMLVT